MFRLFRLWRLARLDLPLLWFALRHPQRPLWLIPALALLALYCLEPMNFALPALGLVDEFIILPMALHWLMKHLPGAIHAQYGGVRVGGPESR